MTTQEVIQNFYHGLQNKSDEWQEHLSENILFADASKKLHAEGKEAFIQSFTSFLKAVANIEVKQLIVEGENGCAVVSYAYTSPKGEILQQDDAEVWKVVNGEVVSLTIYFDITEFRTFMGR